MLKMMRKAAARFARFFAGPAAGRAPAEGRRFWGDGAPAFTIE